MRAVNRYVTKRQGQTFSLVHLVELLLAILVLGVVGMGLMSMVMGTTFLQQYFAKDNAYIMESLHAVPNGEVEYGYLWSAKDFSVAFGYEEQRVAVGRVTRSVFGLLDRSSLVTKAHGTSVATTIAQANFSPQYYQFSVRGKEQRSITVLERVALQSCPEDDSATTISLPRQGDDGLSAQLTGTIVESVRRERSTVDSGPAVAVVFRPEAETNVVVYDRAVTGATVRLACATARSLNRQGISATQDSTANMPSDVKLVDADVVILVRGDATRQSRYREVLVKALLDYWLDEATLAQQVPVGTTPETSTSESSSEEAQ